MKAIIGETIRATPADISRYGFFLPPGHICFFFPFWRAVGSGNNFPRAWNVRSQTPLISRKNRGGKGKGESEKKGVKRIVGTT